MRRLRYQPFPTSVRDLHVHPYLIGAVCVSGMGLFFIRSFHASILLWMATAGAAIWAFRRQARSNADDHNDASAGYSPWWTAVLVAFVAFNSGVLLTRVVGKQTMQEFTITDLQSTGRPGRRGDFCGQKVIGTLPNGKQRSFCPGRSASGRGAHKVLVRSTPFGQHLGFPDDWLH